MTLGKSLDLAEPRVLLLYSESGICSTPEQVFFKFPLCSWLGAGSESSLYKFFALALVHVAITLNSKACLCSLSRRTEKRSVHPLVPYRNSGLAQTAGLFVPIREGRGNPGIGVEETWIWIPVLLFTSLGPGVSWLGSSELIFLIRLEK